MTGLLPLFQQQVDRTPHEMAMSNGVQSMSYAELDQRSNQLAHVLISKGVKSGDQIRLLLPRSMKRVVLELAIFKTGAAFFKEDEQAMCSPEHICITLSRTGSTWQWDLEQLWQASQEVSDLPLGLVSSLQNIVYLCQTSGSTGKPKTLALKQAGLLRLIEDKDHFPLMQGDTILHHMSPTFDPSILETWVALCRGGSVIVLEGANDALSLQGALIKHKPTFLCLTTHMFHLMMNHDMDQFESLKYLVIGGSQLDFEVVLKCQQTYPSLQLINSYGPTENTVVSTFYTLPSPPPNPIPIGSPIKDTELFLLAHDNGWVQEGEVGEIALGGAGLALHLPTQVLEHEAESYALYKTGDLAYQTPEGLVFVGRHDQQVKWLGYRIDLREITQHIRDIKGVKDSHVICDAERLLACVVLDGTSSLATVKQAYKLPLYMFPTQWKVMAQFPLTPHGKIDNPKILSQLAQFQPLTRDALEGLWSDVLKTQIFPQTHFFEAGGQSLQALQMSAMLKEQYQKNIPWPQIFKHPTFEDFWNLCQQISVAPSASNCGDVSQTPVTQNLMFFWRHYLKKGPSPDYNIALKLQFVSPDGFDKLETHLHTLFNRHDVFHMCLSPEPSPHFKFCPGVQPPIDLYDLRDLEQPQAQLESQWIIEQAINTPFVFEENAPLSRFVLIQNTSKSWSLIVVMHHIIGDAQSFQIFTDAFYHLLSNSPSPLPRSGSMMSWLNISRPITPRSLDFWAQEFKQWRPLNWPRLHRPLPNTPSPIQIPLSSELWEKLLEKAKALRTTRHTLCLLAYLLLLSKMTGQKNLSVGLSVSQRDSDFQTMGYLSNTVLLNHLWDSERSLKVTLDLLTQKLQDIYTHSHVSFDHLLEQFQDQPSPFLQTLFVYHQTQEGQEALFTQGSPLDLTFAIEDNPKYPRLKVEYRASNFDQDDLMLLLKFYPRILEAFIEIDNQPLKELSLLKPNVLLPIESRIRDFSQTLNHLAKSEHIALLTPSQSLTYRELNEQVNHLANSLTFYQFEMNQVFGIFLPRGIKAIVTLLALLKNEVPFVYLDPQLPEERLAYICKDAKVKYVICHEHQGFLKPEQHLIYAELMNQQHRDMPSVFSSPLAYITYTSGSSGHPKGIVIYRNDLNHRLKSLTDLYALPDQPRYLQFLPLGFDVGLKEVLICLYQGGTLCIDPLHHPMSPSYFVHLCERWQIDIIHTPPAFWHLLTQYLEKTQTSFPESVKVMITGGEGFSISQAHALAEHLPPGLQFINEYGPSEMTITATTWSISAQELQKAKEVRIGQALKGTQSLVIDPDGQLALPGTVGELYLGGTGLAAGYLNQPQHINASFKRFSLNDTPMDVYCTGDLVRELPDGDLVYMGRKDRQVQIQGKRLEPQELENQLQCVPQLAKAHILVKDPEIWAYLEVNEGIPWEAVVTAARTHLKRVLPDWMLPKRWIQVRKWPLNERGKVDETNLPPPLEPPAVFQPQDLQETRLLAIWSKHLARTTERSDQSFFELGGNSITAIQMLEDVEKTFKSTFQPMLFFQNPTFEQLKLLTLGHNMNPQEVPQEERSLSLAFPLHKGKKKVRHLLITGGTGKLGQYLLIELLQTSLVKIYLISRNKTLSDICELLEKAGHSELLEKARRQVVIIPGDIEKPNLGLSEVAFGILSETIDVIVHMASNLNFFASYQDLKQANVESTRALIKMATQSHFKSFHYVSTIGIFQSAESHQKAILKEVFVESQDANPYYTGYAKTKWVSEQLLKEASDLGVPVSIYRPGRLVGDSKGNCLAEDWMLKFIIGGIQMGSLPDLNWVLGFYPLDLAAKLITEQSLAPKDGAQIFHLVHPEPKLWERFIKHLRMMGFALETLPLKQWQKKLEKECMDKEHPLYGLLPILKDPLFFETFENNSHQVCDYSNLRQAGKSYVSLPPVVRLFEKYILDLVKQAILEYPLEY